MVNNGFQTRLHLHNSNRVTLIGRSKWLLKEEDLKYHEGPLNSAALAGLTDVARDLSTWVATLSAIVRDFRGVEE
jgi:hypothetical protein